MGKGCRVWTILAEAANNPTPSQVPQVPSELIGILLTSLITALTAIVVAIVQRRKPATESGESMRPFVVPEGEWVTTRNLAVTVNSSHQELLRRFDGHVNLSDEAIDKFAQELAYIKGQLGIR